VTVLIANEEIAAFQQTLALWKRRVAKDNCANFPTLENVVFSGEGVLETVPDWIQGDILSHLENLMLSFDDYFVQDELKYDQWIPNPFAFNLDSMNDADMQKVDLIGLQSKALLKQGFSNQNLDEFWCSQIAAYPVLAKKALSALIPFATNYLCETGFSTVVSVKTKARNQLDARHDMRLALSKTVSRISVVTHRKQQQPSY
jgi:hypothetical protein